MSAPDAIFRSASILLVDEHADTRGFVREMLCAEGYAVVEATNGKEAIELLVADREHEPCLIVLDMEMPVMTGLEFLVMIRNYPPLSRIPVLVTSWRGPDLDASHQSGAIAGFIKKPYDLDELRAKVKTCARPAAKT